MMREASTGLHATQERGTPERGLAAAAFALGFALSGFFDGILLHQILQWHHVLSALGGGLRFQVLADGWFHAAMYVIALGGLVTLARCRRGLSAPNAGRRLPAFGLIGFGAWHGVDAALFHRLLGLHRIRMDAPEPMAWDLGWLAAFGIAPLLAGVWILRRPGAGGPGRRLAAGLALLVLAGAGQAAQPAPGGATTVVFSSVVSEDAALERALLLGGPPLLLDPAAGVYVLGRSEARLEDWLAAGAIFVGGAGFAPGCLSGGFAYSAPGTRVMSRTPR